MKDQERIEKMRETARLLTEEADRLLGELDPPRPEPGTVVWFPFDERYGVVSGCGTGVYNEDGELIPREDVQENTTPARILAPDEVAVKIPHTSVWPIESVEARLIWSFRADNDDVREYEANTPRYTRAALQEATDES